MRTIHLLRHAMPVAGANTPPGRWPLSVAGVKACRPLIGRLPTDARRVASGELKAQQTLAVVRPGPHLLDPRLDEVQRPGEPWDDSVRARRRAWVVGAHDHRHDGWETRASAAARIDAVCATWDDDDLVLATHGMVITAWLVGAGLLDAGEEAGRFWENLRFPDLITVERPSVRVREPGRTGGPPDPGRP